MSRLKMLSASAFVLACLAQPLAGAGDKAYKWVDDDGNVNYGAAPPRDQPAEELILRKGPGGTEDAAGDGDEPAPPGADPSENATARGGRPELDGDQRAARRQLNAANCTIARQNLKTLEAMPDHVVERDADGNEVELKNDELAARRERARANVEKFCNQAGAE